MINPNHEYADSYMEIHQNYLQKEPENHFLIPFDGQLPTNYSENEAQHDFQIYFMFFKRSYLW